MPAPVYLDHSATTPVRPEVLEAMQPFFGPRFGNPSSIHRWGREARVALDEARERVARCLGAHPDEICFTSGGTESDNLAVLGAWRAGRARGRRAVVTTPIEHKAVLEAAHTAAREGADERLVAMTADGVADAASFDALVRDDVAVASVMWVNNEMGAIQPVPEFAALAHERGAVFHTDAVQAFSKVHIDAAAVPFDILSISGHKIGAPKGVGALFLRRGTAIEPLFHGGSQDRGRRPGTENVAYAVALATAAELALRDHDAEGRRLAALRDRLQQLLVARIPDLVVNARHAPRAPHILNVSVPGTESESLLMALDLQGIACSGGSACQSGTASPSYVLSAIGVPPHLASAAIRMSLGALTDDAAVDRVADVFPRLVAKARGVAAA
ncbi:MAG: cysteine desulfurase [Gemmatimonadota bacterium]|nr:cysteine desulfurase [Gemmatimonadota bacterium]MDE3126535.1 cysteine desulfurase [Gemmatimonadota bacterium]MDE3173042.1 cysteine desulfurase [Gemmatimonadota bacterium]MDE3215105.1 cysteine desulfurase [Gemmatimonadota bacterium]